MIDRLSRLDLPGQQLTLRRAWPRSAGHLLLEYVDEAGGLVPGQWIDDSQRLRHVAAQTRRRCRDASVVVVESEGVLLQPGGADRRLVGLFELVSRPEATLVTHRPERRAVVRLDDQAVGPFAKVVSPSRLDETMTPVRHLAALNERPFAVPEILSTDGDRGIVVWSALPGVSLHGLLGEGDRLVVGARAAGEALRWLHDCPAWSLPTHDAVAEIELLRIRIARLKALEPAVYEQLGAAPQRIYDVLAAEPCGPTVIHRDFHDKQVFLDHDRLGLLDFDTAALGEPALDVGNMLAHLEWRAIQNRCPHQIARRAAEAFLAGYEPSESVRNRLGAYLDATRLRLACLYAYRPQWRHLCAELVARLRSPLATVSSS